MNCIRRGWSEKIGLELDWTGIDSNSNYGTLADLSAGAVASSEVAALSHEVGDDSVEAGALVSEAGLASAKLPEVLGALWRHIVVELRARQAENKNKERQP